jgi:hypothetical protein
MKVKDLKIAIESLDPEMEIVMETMPEENEENGVLLILQEATEWTGYDGTKFLVLSPYLEEVREDENLD